MDFPIVAIAIRRSNKVLAIAGRSNRDALGFTLRGTVIAIGTKPDIAAVTVTILEKPHPFRRLENTSRVGTVTLRFLATFVTTHGAIIDCAQLRFAPLGSNPITTRPA